jgi:hypothetical protein
MLAFDGLGRELGCLFVVADHAGKDISKGARGGSAKSGKARLILTVPEKVANHAEHRTLTVKKQRNLPDGWGMELWFELVEVQTAGGKTATNLAACWGAEGQGEDDQDETSDGIRLPRLQLAALLADESPPAPADIAGKIRPRTTVPTSGPTSCSNRISGTASSPTSGAQSCMAPSAFPPIGCWTRWVLGLIQCSGRRWERG